MIYRLLLWLSTGLPTRDCLLFMHGHLEQVVTLVALIHRGKLKTVKHLRRGYQGVPLYRPDCFTV